MIVYTLASGKGGVGKTTTTANLAAGLALLGNRVLAVDADPQGHLTNSFGITAREGASLGEALQNSEMDPRQAVYVPEMTMPEGPGHLHVLATVRSSLETAEHALTTNPLFGLTSLSLALGKLAGDYDYVVIDTPPRLTMLTATALKAADAVIAVAQPKTLSMAGAMAIRTTVKGASAQGEKVRFLGTVFNQYDPEPEETRMVEEGFAEMDMPVLETKIPDSTLASKAVNLGAPAIVVYANYPIGRTYRSFVAEVQQLTLAQAA